MLKDIYSGRINIRPGCYKAQIGRISQIFGIIAASNYKITEDEKKTNARDVPIHSKYIVHWFNE